MKHIVLSYGTRVATTSTELMTWMSTWMSTWTRWEIRKVYFIYKDVRASPMYTSIFSSKIEISIIRENCQV